MSPATPREKKSPNLWLALLPGLLVLLGATGMFFWSRLSFLRAATAITAPDPNDAAAASKPAPSELLACLDTYGITMHTSEFYVAEYGGFRRPRPKNAPNELSTVLRGMVRNNCGRPLRQVSIYIEVNDAEGKRGQAWVPVGNIEQGQAGEFEKAWIGRVTEYKVTKAR
jgi:hypothetical protein